MTLETRETMGKKSKCAAGCGRESGPDNELCSKCNKVERTDRLEFVCSYGFWLKKERQINALKRELARRGPRKRRDIGGLPIRAFDRVKR